MGVCIAGTYLADGWGPVLLDSKTVFRELAAVGGRLLRAYAVHYSLQMCSHIMSSGQAWGGSSFGSICGRGRRATNSSSSDAAESHIHASTLALAMYWALLTIHLLVNIFGVKLFSLLNFWGIGYCQSSHSFESC
ncbi:hypothetical protein GCG54_00008197 [Colletotrichum gloeosporioides]|uniref:Uncharacterized protein n=1 Tax=Colletotrichum gloeosporioides TaxID=474922 RepID=A0A8H4C7M8_COLGL|nr:uncharacterized protein GCG54_00008197 [Colletotrichum gloeosporioides]KAF3798742.1 hypothetical protein GCG54_00008197 [Colletotrichum gloeosporioides]